jgi:hypothetical protein
MSNAIKAMVRHHAALAQIDERRRQAAARRFDVNTVSKRHRSRRSLMVRARTLRLSLKGGSS